MFWKLITAIALDLACSLASADGGAKVYVAASSSNSVGSRFMFMLRENIRASKSMELVLSPEDAFFTLHVVSLDPNTPEDGVSTVYTVVWTVKQLSSNAEIYWQSKIGTCGRTVVGDCAATITADTDRVVLDVQQSLIDAFKKSAK